MIDRPDKVLFPETGFTKQDLADYHAAVAEVILPHLAGRPLTLARFPDGVRQKGWYETTTRGAPPWLRTVEVPASRGAPPQRPCIVDDAAGLAWVANRGAIELHPFLARAEAPDAPRCGVIDLDPRPPAGLVDAARAAPLVRDALGVPSFVKTSGRRGVHVLFAARGDFARTRAFAREIAAELVARHPQLLVGTAVRAAGPGKIYVDTSANNATRSLVAPYSLRATPWPLAATPLDWDELEALARAGDPRRLCFTPPELLARLDARGDLLASLA